MFFSSFYFSSSGGVDGLEDGVVRKRKCRDVFTSYKEPATVKISKKMSSDTSSASDGDSDNDDDQSNSDEEEKGGVIEDSNKRRRVDKRSSGSGKVDWKEVYINRVLAVMLNSSVRLRIIVISAAEKCNVM